MRAAENDCLRSIRLVLVRQFLHELADFLSRRHALHRTRETFARHLDDRSARQRPQDAFLVSMRRNRGRRRKDRHTRHARKLRKIETHPDDRHRLLIKRRRHVECNRIARDDHRLHVLRQKKPFPFLRQADNLLARPLPVRISGRIAEIHHRFLRIPRLQDPRRREPAGPRIHHPDRSIIHDIPFRPPLPSHKAAPTNPPEAAQSAPFPST